MKYWSINDWWTDGSSGLYAFTFFLILIKQKGFVSFDFILVFLFYKDLKLKVLITFTGTRMVH